MIKTKYIGLLKPADGAEEWGHSLNDNFDIIDSKLNATVQMATTQFISTGLYEALKGDLTWTPNTNPTEVTTPLLKGFFPSDVNNFATADLPGTNDQISVTISIAECEQVAPVGNYNNYYFGIVLEKNLIKKIIKTKLSDFPINDGKTIYLGNLVAKTEGGAKSFVKELSMLKPWFCNFSANDRAIDMATHGTLQGGYIAADGDALIPKGKFIWIHEGINAHNPKTMHFLEGTVKTDHNHHIQFYRSFPDSKIGSEELILYTKLDPTQFLQGGMPHRVTNNYYTVQRYGILENGYSVVTYGGNQFATKQEAINSIPLLQPVSAMINIKEIAYVIVKNSNGIAAEVEIINKNETENTNNYGYFREEDLTIYNNTDLIKFDINGTHILSTDSYHKDYVLADAGCLYSNGIIPSEHLVFSLNNNVLTYNQFKVVLVEHGLYQSTKITEHKYGNLINGNTVTLSIEREGWYKLVCQEGSFALIGINAQTTSSQTLIGYVYSNGVAITNSIIAPEIFTTTPSSRLEFNAAKISVNGLYASVSAEKQIALQSGVILSEGINFTNPKSPNIKHYSGVTGSMNNRISWFSIDEKGNKTSNVQTSSLPSLSGRYGIHILFVGANGEYYVLSDKNGYSTKAAAKEQLYQQLYNISPNVLLEIIRIIVPPTGVSESAEIYYTNQRILGNLQISTVDPSQLIPNYNINDFTLFNNGGESIKFSDKTGYSALPSEMKIFSNGLGIGNIQAPTNTDSAHNGYYVKFNYNNGNPYYELAQLDLASVTQTIRNLTNRVEQLEREIQNKQFVTYTTTSYGSTSDYGQLGQIRYRTASGSRRYVEIYNGSNWEIMNTWQ